jgi:LPS export ABC transporter protein LptC
MPRSEPRRLRAHRPFSGGALALLAGLALLPLATGCQEQLAREEPAIPFVFRSLQLSQNDSRGKPAWTLSSPEARYDMTRRLAQARELRGVLYAQGQPVYQLRARSGVVLGDGALIQFEGEVNLRRLGRDPLAIKAQRVRWYPRKGVMELDQRPVATERDLQLSAQRAIFLIDKEKLELRGEPQIRRITEAGANRDGRARNDLVLEATSADWYPASGDLQAQGPIRGMRTPRPGQPPQTLTSPALRGNTLQQQLVLAGPVRFEDRGAKAWLEAGETWVNLPRQEASSPMTFKGQLGRLQLNGEGFVFRQLETLVVIQPGCRLRQPGESLSAERCQWNWTTQGIEAEGSVELRRQASDQVTKSGRLTGRMGNNGMALFTSPGSRVNTRLRLQNQRRPGNQGSSAESGAKRISPIRL